VHVSDGFRTHYWYHRTDDDFWYDANNQFQINTPGKYAHQETNSIYTDACAEKPIGIEIGQKTYTWDTYPDNKYVIIEYSLKNISNHIISNLFAGLVVEWIEWLNAGDFARDENLGYFFHSYSNSDASRYRGIAAINHDGIRSYRIITIPDWPTGGISDTILYNSLSSGIVDTSYWADNNTRLIQAISTGPFTLYPGDCDTAIFAFLGADSLSELKKTARRARQKILEVIEESKLPKKFLLKHNYPNPFNAMTIIEYELPRTSAVKVEIFNILGQKVKTLANENQQPGYHRLRWNATNDNGIEVASGIYFYRIQTEHYTEARKMLLLK
jgi:hypothetical protein